jgi:predicted nucleic acid-binding protein
MKEAIDVCVLDTSAWLTLIEDEPGADMVQELLEKAKTGEVIILTSFMSFMEVYYISMQEGDEKEAQARLDLMAALPVTRMESTEGLAVMAGELKAKHHFSVADAWIAALAKEQNATLIHKDPDFEQVEGAIRLLALPYKVDA